MKIKRLTYAIAAILASGFTLFLLPYHKAYADDCDIGDRLDPFNKNCSITNPTVVPETIRRNLIFDWYHVYIHNKTNRPIWVAVHYRYRNNTPRFPKENLPEDIYYNWVTKGYWKLAPGEKALILDDEDKIDNRYIYFHAHDEQGNYWGSDEYSWVVKMGASPQRFFKKDMGGTIGEYFQGFTRNQ